MTHGRYVVLLLWLGPSALAQPIYRWVDEEGVTHYTNDASVPRGQRAQVTRGDEISVISTPPTKRASASAPSRGATAEQNAQPQDVGDEQQWRRAFRDAYARIAELQSAIESDRNLERYGRGVPWRFPSSPIYGRGRLGWFDPWYDEVDQRIRQNEAELRQAREALDDLERNASREAVPREWRR